MPDQSDTAHVAVGELLARFFRGLDMFETDTVAACFAPQGTWLRKGSLLTGPAEIAEALGKRSTERRTCHSVSNLIVTREGEMIRARYYLTVWASNSGAPLQTEYVLDSSDLMTMTGHGLRFFEKRSAPLLRG